MIIRSCKRSAARPFFYPQIVQLMTKEELRTLYRKKRQGLDQDTRHMYDHAILRRLKEMDWSQVSYIHTYLPMSDSNEPDTVHFVNWLRSIQQDIQFVVSRSNFKSHEMVHYLWDQDTVLEVNRWGILEPKEGIVIDPDKIDVVLVPLLIIDSYGNRVGYGKGFYDRFLVDCRPDVKSIGLSYFDPVDKITDVGKWDVQLKCCVSPSGVYHY